MKNVSCWFIWILKMQEYSYMNEIQHNYQSLSGQPVLIVIKQYNYEQHVQPMD